MRLRAAGILVALFLIGCAADAGAWTVSISANKSSPQPVGTQITFTASVSGISGWLEYSFLVSTNGGSSWSTLANTGTDNRYVWTPTQGRTNWLIKAWVGFVECDEWGDCYYTQENTSNSIPFATEAPVVGVSLYPNKPSGQPLGTTVIWTVNPSGGTQPVSVKWLQSADGGATWSMLQDWAAIPATGSLNWTPTQAGTLYLIRVLARNALSTNPNGETSGTDSFVINGPAISSLTVTSDRPSPQLPGTPITWTANVTGGIRPLIYKYGVWANGGWITQTGTSSSNQFSWTPSLANTDYTVWAWVWSATMDPASESAERSVSVPFSTRTAVSSVAIAANKTSPQPLGTSITWTATPNGGIAPYSYKWSVSTDGGSSWTIVQNWTANASQLTVTPSVATTLYRVSAAVRSAGSTNDSGEATGSSANFTLLGPPVSALTLTANKPSPQPPGTAITWTVTPTGGTAPVYYYWTWRDWNGHGGILRDWSTDPQLVWTPTSVNDTWEIDVAAASATADFEAINNGAEEPEAGTGAMFSTATTVLSVALAADRASGQSAGTTVNFTATPRAGTAPYSYKWLLSANDGASWTTLQDWTVNANRYAWTPTVANSLYRVQVAVRSAGSTNSSGEASNYLRFAIVGPPITALTLTPDRPSPQPPGTAITWTATATGGTAPIYYYWGYRDFNGHSGTLRDWSTNPQLVWTPTTVEATWEIQVVAASATADFEAINLGIDDPEASASAIFSTATTVLRVGLTADRPTGQLLGTTINWTATPVGGTAPLSYKWMVSFDDGSTWTLLRDWTATANPNRYAWTPSVASSRYQVGVWVRSAGSSGSGEASNAARFVVTDGVVRSVALSVNKTSPQVAGTPITWTVTTTGGTAPIYYEWWVSPNNGGSWTLLRELGTSNQVVWSPQDTSTQYKISVNAWSYDADFENEGPQATATSASYTITPRVSGLTLTASKRSPQPVGTAITWTATATSGTPPLSYRWKQSSDGGATWTLLQDWSATATRSWTPTAVSAKTLFMVSVRSATNTDVDGEATAYANYVVTNSSGALVVDTFNAPNNTLLRNRTPETAPSGVTWMITGAGDPKINQSKQAKAGTGSGYEFATVDPSLTDAIVAVDVIVASGTNWGGLALRLADVNNFLAVRFSTTLELTQVQGGQSSTLGSSNPSAAPGTHRLEARLDGDRIRIYWDNQFQFQGVTTFQQNITRHGLAWNLSSSTNTIFDNFDLRPATIVITGPADRTDSEETNVNTRVTATDSQGATLTYSAMGLPPELTINSSTGDITGRLSADAAGLRTVTLRASAGTRFAEKTMQWLVMCPAGDYLVSPFSQPLYTAGGGTATVWVVTSSQCPWVAYSKSDFLTVVSSGQLRMGTEEVQIEYMNNPSLQPRVGTASVAGQTVLLTQPGEQGWNCNIAVSTGRVDFNADGGSGSFSFTPSYTWCQWQVVVQGSSWIHLSGRSSGTGPSTLTVSVDRNTLTSSRTGYIAINGTIVVVDQSPDLCTFGVEYTVWPSLISPDGESHDLQVYAGNGCGWDAWSNTSWLHITEFYPPNNPTGNGHIRFSVDSNPDTAPRTGTLTVVRQTVTITQAGRSGPPDDNDTGSTEDVLYYHLDAIGSVRMLTDKTRAVQGRYDYMPFGTEYQATNSANVLRFTGKERDQETAGGSAWPALTYFGARYYQGQTGRFTAVDPALAVTFEDPQSWNRYSYTNNRPLRFVDPSGRWPTEIHLELIRDAFPGLSQAELHTLNLATYAADFYPAYTIDPVRHALRPGDLNLDDPSGKTNAFIEDKVQLANIIQGGRGSTRVLNSRALLQFGYALHALMDSTSPAHRDQNGNPGPFSWWYLFPHREREATITSAQRDETIALMRLLFERAFGDAQARRATPPKACVQTFDPSGDSAKTCQ